MKTLSTLFRECALRVGAVDAQILIQEAYEKLSNRSLSRFELFFDFSPVSPDLSELVSYWTLKREQGILLQHITGIQIFGKNRYQVSSDVLIPRQETEILLQVALEDLRLRKVHRGIELGLGAGILSIELLSEFPHLAMAASEVSKKAGEIALKNAHCILKQSQHRLTLLYVENPQVGIEIFEGARADFLISNPPYLRRCEKEVENEVRIQEPDLALFPAHSNENYFYENISTSAHRILSPEGRLFLEIPHERASLIRDLFQAKGWKVNLVNDLTSRPRVLIANL